MKTMSTTDLKKNFFQVLKQVKAGETIAVTYGKTKKIIGYFIQELSNKPKRQLGILEGIATVTFSKDWEVTAEEFLGED